MYRKLICLLTFIVVLGTAGNASADLVGYWKFDEGSGTIAYDSSGNGNDGTLEDDPTVVDGQFGQALAFDGSRVTIPASDSLTADLFQGSFTLSAWINPTRTGNAWQQVFRAVTASATNDTLFLNNNGTLSWRGTVGGAWAGGMCETAPDAVPADQWTHAAVVGDGANFRIYINGVLSQESAFQTTDGANTTYYIGGTVGGESYAGMIDDVRIYNNALSEAEIQSAMSGEGFPYAMSPNPADGSLLMQTWASLGWKPGDFAVSHDIYFGDNFDDVNDATRDSELFRATQDLDAVYFVVGFPTYPYPDGLVNGDTYYWRIDEVNDANSNSPWKGKIWSFSIPSLKAYYPVPSAGSKFIDSENLTLTWTPGFGSVLHTVYFGDDYDTVANDSGGMLQGPTTFSPGPLEVEKTYFWRVDELDELQSTHTGDVWSFTTAKAGGGVRGDYYHWNDPTFVGGGGNPGPGQAFTSFVLTRTDPQIDFTFSDSPDPSMNVDLFSARWTGEVEAGFTETYTFYARADDGVRLWIDGQQLVDAWIDQGPTEYSGEIDLVAGNSYSLVMEYYENGGGAVAELRWSSPSTPKQFVPQAALSLPVKASSPSPSNGATGTKMTPILRWGAGESAASHEVYFGTDANAVKNATTASPEYIGPRALGDESYDPGKLAWATSYFWRVDEVNNLNPDSPWIGNLWTFTTGDFLVVDDFEDYDIGNNEIWFSWNDGLGAGAPGTPEFVPSNGTGSMIGDDTTGSYTEETIVHSGNQSMPYWYDNNKQGFSKYSEAKLTLTAPRDWTEEGVTELSLWFRGYPGSVGSFVEGPVGTFTMTASGADIWTVNGVEADEFHFAYKTLSGVGSIQAQVLSIDNTNDWAKAGVMIRETLDPDSGHAYMVVTPTQGVSFQRRPGTGAASSSANSATGGSEAAPYWVKIERDIGGNFIGSSSTNGSAWTPLDIPVNIAMASNVYIGLAVTSHDAALTCQAVFSNVTTTGTVSPQWAHQDIGITSNAPEPLYVAVSNIGGAPAVVVHDDPAAATIDTWTEWVISLQDLADKGIVLTNVDSIAIGLGTQGNITIPGGSGKMYFDDIRLYRPREVAE